MDDDIERTQENEKTRLIGMVLLPPHRLALNQRQRKRERFTLQAPNGNHPVNEVPDA